MAGAPKSKYTGEQKEFVLNSNGTAAEIKKEYETRFGGNISIRAIRHIRERYGARPYHGRYTQEQIKFVLDAKGTMAEIAEGYNAQFGTNLTKRGIRQIRDRFAKALPSAVANGNTGDDAEQGARRDRGVLPGTVTSAALHSRATPSSPQAEAIVEDAEARVSDALGTGMPAVDAQLARAPALHPSMPAFRPLTPRTLAFGPLVPLPAVTLSPMSQLLAPYMTADLLQNNQSPTNNQAEQTGPVDGVYGGPGPWYPAGHNGCPIDALYRHTAEGRVDFPSTQAVVDMLERAGASTMMAPNWQQIGYGGLHPNAAQQNMIQSSSFQQSARIQENHFQQNPFHNNYSGQDSVHQSGFQQGSVQQSAFYHSAFQPNTFGHSDIAAGGIQTAGRPGSSVYEQPSE